MLLKILPCALQALYQHIVFEELELLNLYSDGLQAIHGSSKHFSLHHSIQIDSGATLSPIQRVPGNSVPGAKVAES
jgi:hypothetical protein